MAASHELGPSMVAQPRGPGQPFLRGEMSGFFSANSQAAPWNSAARLSDRRDVQQQRWAGVVPWLATAARILLGGVFVYAGVLKLPDPAAAERAVRAYRLLPESLVGVAAFGLPVIEIAVGLALLAGVFVRTAAVAASVLLALYIAAIASVWARGLSIDCGCFSRGGQVAAGATHYPAEIARDAALLLVALALARWPRSRLALGQAPDELPEPSEREVSRAR
jgi:uncharacterized membrane protein YphA (DoxX/SURF4 family)